MKKHILSCIITMWSMIASAQLMTVTETVFDHDAATETFAFGADISWLSQQEKWGTYYCNRQGKKADLMDILKEDFGINALRFRVWVNPSDGWSGKQDVIGLCKRAHAKGFKIMISFHYSDTWADPGSQTIPAQWTDHSVEALEKNVYDHTHDVLSGLQSEGITPVWVSIGNETNGGMLFETGRTNSTEGYQNFARFISAGAKAVKEIDEHIITIVHLSNAHDEAAAKSMFNNLNKYGATYDCIGLSAYPRWSHLDITNDTQIASTVNKYMTTFRNLKSTFNKPVMVMETGHYGKEPYDANRFFADFLKALIADKELGCFYWEPEAFDNGGYELGAWSSDTHQGTIAMDAFKGIKHTKVDKYATTRISELNDMLIYAPADTVRATLYANTGNTVSSLSTIDFCLNGKKTLSVAAEKSHLFTFETDTLPRGCYTFHALVHDNQGHTVSSDTLCFLVDDVTVFQENEEGFAGASDDYASSVEKSIKRYTGEGYLPNSTSRKSSLAWDATFPSADTYTLYVRYHTTETRFMQFKIDGQSIVLTAAPSPQGKWAYVAKEFNITNPGLQHITMQGYSNKGFPDLDFIAIASSTSCNSVLRGEGSTGIVSLRMPSPTVIYDLQGHPLTSSLSVLPRGTYIQNGRKFVR